jgi:glycine/D-amino acid oxidase-like deaminating enzyme
VIGAGITGALVADALVEAGIDTIVLDKRTAACGSTSANTALFLYELDTPLRDLIGMHGQAPAVRVYHLCVEAVRTMGSIAQSLNGDCCFEMRKSLYLASALRDVPELFEECGLRERYGIPCEFLNQQAISERFPFTRPAAILSRDAAQLDPYQFTQLLLRRAITRGLRVFERTELATCEPTAYGVRVLTKAGATIRARQIVYATGYECAGEFPAPLTQSHITYAVVSEPIEDFDGWWERCLMWETARPYFYLRTTSGGRAMLGGEDDDSTTGPSPQTLAHKSRLLQRKFSGMFPHLKFRPAKAWSGIFKSTRDGLPFIGPRPGYPNALFALGYGGNGMTFSVIAAKIIRDLCMGQENRDVELFQFDR